jgi:hypothetical protein
MKIKSIFNRLVNHPVSKYCDTPALEKLDKAFLFNDSEIEAMESLYISLDRIDWDCARVLSESQSEEAKDLAKKILYILNGKEESILHNEKEDLSIDE